MNDARGLAVTSGSAECVAALDRAAESYLGFRADMGAQVNAAVEADPGAPLAQVMKGYLGMLLSNANALGMVDDCLNAAHQTRCASVQLDYSTASKLTHAPPLR